MRRIQPPKCTICLTSSASVESDVWSSLRMCEACRRDAIDFIFDSGVIHGNPILIELAGPGDNGNRDGAIRIWRPRANQSGTYYEFFIRTDNPDSQKFFEIGLDILNDL